MNNGIQGRRRLRIFERDEWRCFYCGTEVTLFAADSNCGPIPAEKLRTWASVDHLTPISQGGSNDDSNLITACRTCNAQKKDRTLEEYREFCSHRHNGYGIAADKLVEALRIVPTPFDDTLWEAVKWLRDERPQIQFWGEADCEVAA